MTVVTGPGPILPGDPPLTLRRALAPPIGSAAIVLLLTACMPAADPVDTRRAAYLDCARDQGLTVIDGTIRSSGPGDLDRLQACEAIPR